MHVSRVTSKNEGEPQIDKSFKSISLSLNECFPDLLLVCIIGSNAKRIHINDPSTRGRLGGLAGQPNLNSSSSCNSSCQNRE